MPKCGGAVLDSSNYHESWRQDIWLRNQREKEASSLLATQCFPNFPYWNSDGAAEPLSSMKDSRGPDLPSQVVLYVPTLRPAQAPTDMYSSKETAQGNQKCQPSSNPTLLPMPIAPVVYSPWYQYAIPAFSIPVAPNMVCSLFFCVNDWTKGKADERPDESRAVVERRSTASTSLVYAGG